MNRPTLGQLVNVLLAIDKAHTVPQSDLDLRPGVSWLNYVYGPNHPTHSV